VLQLDTTPILLHPQLNVTEISSIHSSTVLHVKGGQSGPVVVVMVAHELGWVGGVVIVEKVLEIVEVDVEVVEVVGGGGGEVAHEAMLVS
jgi:hypothetical protein